MECGQSPALGTDWGQEASLAQILIDELIKWTVANEMLTINGDELRIVIEDFILRPGPHGSARSGLSPVRMTCWLQAALLENLFYHNYISLQSPSQAKGFMTDARLKAVGWWAVGKPHSRDALRHTATYVAAYRNAARERG